MSLFDRFSKNKTAGQLAKRTEAKETKKKAGEAKSGTDESKESSSPVVPGQGGRLAYRVLVKPLVTEKTAVMQSEGKYTFVVASWAKKTAIKEAIKEMYGVLPRTVNVVNMQGHRVRFGKGAGSRSDYKKAIVTLPEGKSITIHEGV